MPLLRTSGRTLAELFREWQRLPSFRHVDWHSVELRVRLCGMDTYCSCHEVGGKRRCWTTEADCDVDRACCAAGKCDGMKQDACTKKTQDERKRRDGKAK